MGEKTFPTLAEAAFASGKTVSWAVCGAEVQVWAFSTFWRGQLLSREFIRAFLCEDGCQGRFPNSSQAPLGQNMEVAGEDAAVMLNDKVLIAGCGHGTAVGMSSLQLVHDAVEEPDGDAALVVGEPFVKYGNEEIPPLARRDCQLP